MSVLTARGESPDGTWTVWLATPRLLEAVRAMARVRRAIIVAGPVRDVLTQPTLRLSLGNHTEPLEELIAKHDRIAALQAQQQTGESCEG